VKGWIESALIDAQNIGGELSNTLRDSPAMHRLKREHLQDEKVDGPLQQLVRSRHTFAPSVIDKRLQKKEQTRQFRAAAKNRGFIGDDGNPGSRWLFDLFVFSCTSDRMFFNPKQTRHPERSAAQIRRIWRAVEGPRRCLLADALRIFQPQSSIEIEKVTISERT
jgi:hypothetical protein